MSLQTTEAWERQGTSGPFLIICEHASSRIPSPLTTNTTDDRWLDTHWGYDIGARQLSLALARLTGSQALLARFSRLLCDTNRHRDHEHLIRPDIEGEPLSFNAGLDEAEVIRRVELYHEPYHQQINAMLEAADPTVFLLSVHSFTPIWDDHIRTMDIGVLFDEQSENAHALQRGLEGAGFFTALNEPYSGRDNLMYAADRHGRQHNIRHLELELNQATICTPQRIERVAARMAPVLMGLL